MAPVVSIMHAGQKRENTHKGRSAVMGRLCDLGCIGYVDDATLHVVTVAIKTTQSIVSFQVFFHSSLHLPPLAIIEINFLYV